MITNNPHNLIAENEASSIKSILSNIENQIRLTKDLLSKYLRIYELRN